MSADSVVSGVIFAMWGGAYTLGLIMLSFLGLVWKRSSDHRCRATFTLMLPFFLLVVAITLSELAIRINAPDMVQRVINLSTNLPVVILVFAFPYFTHEMMSSGYRHRISVFFGGIAALCGVVLFLGIGLGYVRLTRGVLFLCFFLSIAYSILTGLTAHWQSGSDGAQAQHDLFIRSAQHMAVVGLVFLPLFVLFDFFFAFFPFLHDRVSPSFSLLPLFFMIWSVDLLLHLIPVIPAREREPDEFAVRRDSIVRQYKLSEREAEVLVFLSDGAAYKSIADSLCVSLATVKTHISRIYAKTGCSCRAELIHFIRSG